jgi:hypothetical protein
MENTRILNAGVASDSHMIHVGPHNGVEPNAGKITDRDLAHYRGIRSNKNAPPELGRLLTVRL